LKIMEVSSKHQHQAISIQIQLQQVRSGSFAPIGPAVKSSPLHVQSRINKRKRASSGPGKPRKRSRGDSDINYVDITFLLVLPQKEAATKLGISESMLCKRFKECTRRKWPYRYLRKIDKTIRVLTLNKKSEEIPMEDQEKIQRLKAEREECLLPVRIRITGQDKGFSGGVTPGETLKKKKKRVESEEEFEEDIENDLSEDGYDDSHDDGELADASSQVTCHPSLAPIGPSVGRQYTILPPLPPMAIHRQIPVHRLRVEDEDEIAEVVSTLNLLKTTPFSF